MVSKVHHPQIFRNLRISKKQKTKKGLNVDQPKTSDERAQLLGVNSAARVDVKLVKDLLVVGHLEVRLGVDFSKRQRDRKAREAFSF